MAAELETENPQRTEDVFKVFVLTLIASVLGVYLIATTAVISKDGVMYIEQARRFQSEPLTVTREISVGYPFLIFATHKLAAAFGAGSSAVSWTYSAQSVTLLCRVLALVPLYFVGKLLAGGTRSCRAMVILVILPYPAQFGSDALRDWPHILFLATGLWFLFWGARDGKWWMFGASGLAAGLGHIIRPECAQVLVYGVSWILIRLVAPEQNMKRPALVGAMAGLLLGFAIPAAPYMAARGQILPQKLKEYISASPLWKSEANNDAATDSGNTTPKASAFAGKTAAAIGRLAAEMSDSLMYYFVPALLLGAYARIRRESEASHMDRFFLPAFVFLNVLMMIMLYRHWGYISRRHCLPLVVLLIFYVPVGLEILAQWIDERFSKDQKQGNRPSQRWFFILLAIGIGICLPKLLSPLGYDKRGYRDAAEWLRLNSEPEDVVAVPDPRISLYAERKGIRYAAEIPEGTDYIVRVIRDQDEEEQSGRTGRKEYSARVDAGNKGKKRVVVYRTM